MQRRVKLKGNVSYLYYEFSFFTEGYKASFEYVNKYEQKDSVV